MSVPGAPVIDVAPFSSANTLEFAWTPPTTTGGSPITSYRFQLGSDTPVILGPTVFYYRVTGLVNGQLYTASIEAGNTNGYGPKALFREFAPGTTVPNPPATATATAITGTSNAMVNWTPPSVLPDSPIFWYVLESVSNNSADPVQSITADGVTQRSYLITGLNRNSRYSFDVQSVNCPGYSSALRTNTIQFFDPGDVKLATRTGGPSGSGAVINSTTVACDTAGNVYHAIDFGTGGTYELFNYSSAPVGGGSVGTTSAGTIFAFQNITILVKYNSEGVVQWATYLRKGNFTSTKTSLATDSAGNLYAAFGAYDDFPTTTIYNGVTASGGSFSPTSYGELPNPYNNRSCGCIVKYNTSGVVQWAAAINGDSSDSEIVQMICDTSGNVYVTIPCSSPNIRITSFSAAPGTPGGNITMTTFGTYARVGTSLDGFIVKYNTSGVAQWATSVSNLNSGSASGIGVDNSTFDVYVLTRAASTSIAVRSFTNVTSGTINTSIWGTITTGTASSSVLVKYNSSGAAQWATRTQVGNLSGESFITVDSSNNIYIASTWTGGPLTILYYNYTSGGGGGSAITTTQNGQQSYSNAGSTCILTKYSSSGVLLRLTTAPGNTGSSITQKSTCDSAGNLYVATRGDTNLTLNNYNSQPSPAVTGNWGLISPGSIQGLGSADSFIVKYNSNLVVEWGARIGGTIDENHGGLSLDTLGNVWFVGSYRSNPTTISEFGSLTFPGGFLSLTTFGTLPALITASFCQTFLVKYVA